MILKEDVFEIGRITRTHGLKGEVECSMTDLSFDDREADYIILEMDEILVPFFLEEYRFKSDYNVLMTFEGIDSAEKAQRLTGHSIFLPRTMQTLKSPDEMTMADLRGFIVRDQTHGELGSIIDVDDSTENVLFLLPNDILVPASDDLVTDIDYDARIIHMQLPEGLIS